MLFSYDRTDWKTLEQGEENSWLLTNGLGGYQATTAIHSVNRCDSGLLIGAVRAPDKRWNLVHRLSEKLWVGKSEHWISSQSFADGTVEDGWRYLSSFTWEDIPNWKYDIDSVVLERSCGMKYEENTAAVQYRICNRGDQMCRFSVQPSFLFSEKGQVKRETPDLVFQPNQVTDGNITVYLHTNQFMEGITPVAENLYYAYDARDGRPDRGKSLCLCECSCVILPKQTVVLEIVFSDKPCPASANQIIAGCRERQREIRLRSPFVHPEAKQLAQSADAFLVHRESTGGFTIMAGYPLFGDWGRDTMIALPGCVLAAGEVGKAKEIIRTFLKYENNGLLPNVFPDGETEPMYNTVDAALLCINCIWLYWKKTGDTEFLREVWPVMKRIIHCYQIGTDYHIYMDTDGLLCAGQGLEQVTWMDIRINDILPTPRHGKPVEINAYWYNALCIMERISDVMGESGEAYGDLKRRVKKSFCDSFWMAEKGYLKDVISGTKADEQLRCNQIWAVSMPFSMLSEEQAAGVVRAVEQHLYTEHGLRTLSPEDPEFHPFYGGEQFDRDMAYHQGTIWPFPMGGFYLAWLRVHGNTKEAARQVEELLKPMEQLLREGCAGQLPEVYDGIHPRISKGCYAQAWSVGEILRAYQAVEAIQRGETL